MTEAAVVYDSALVTPGLRRSATELWRFRGLFVLLVRRRLTVQYKRSLLGAWWTLLTPLLTTLILWVVFGQLFRFPTPGVPYVVYLLSGVLLVSFVTEGLLEGATALRAGEGVVTKVHVPAEAFVLAAVAAAGVNFLIGLLPLAIVQVATGVGIPATAVLVPILAAATFLFVAGGALLLASASIVFYDVVDFTRIGVRLLTYVTPMFYPIAIVPEHLRPIIRANPVTAHLVVFRDLMWGGRLPPAWALAVVLLTAVVTITVGTVVFARRWPRVAALL